MSTEPEAAAIAAAQRIHHQWDEALGEKNLDAAMRLYAEDATLESPLVRHLLGGGTDIIVGKEQLRRFVEMVFQRTPSLRQRYRTRFFTDGEFLLWEYPRATPDGEQMDLVEVMEIREGLIRHHRVYWGCEVCRCWREMSTGHGDAEEHLASGPFCL